MRDRKPNAKKGGWDSSDMERAVEDVLKNSVSERTAARNYNVSRSTLKRKLKEAHRNPETHSCLYKPYAITSMKVFSDEEEEALVEYCISASKMGYGLSTAKLRSLAFEFADKLDKRLPHSSSGQQCNPWVANEKAGIDWLRAFMKRHPQLSIRKPDPTSIGRMSAFNRHNIQQFYANIERVLKDRELEAHQLWNCDETGITTVQVPERIIAEKGERQVAAVTSAERGTLVTMCNAVNASGSTIPPFYIFPRVHFRDHFLRNSVPGSGGAANPSGWMIESTFVEWFNHFVKHVRPSPESPVLLVLDNHETHLSIAVIDKAKEHGVILVTIPPHTSHKLQPLDVSIYGPFKRLYNREISAWLLSNPGKTVSIYDLAEISGKAWTKACFPSNVISGFQSAGIHPFQPDKWTDEDFSLAQVTDRPAPQSDAGSSAHSIPATSSGPNNVSVPQATDPVDSVETEPPVADLTNVETPKAGSSEGGTGKPTPETVRPLPKAPARKRINTTGRKKLMSEILTSTPVKERLQKEQNERKEKRRLMAEHAERKVKQTGKKRKLTIAEQEANEVTVTEMKATCKGKSRSNKAKGKRLPKKPKKGRDQKDGKQKKVTSATDNVKRRPITSHYKPPRSPSKRPILPRKPIWLTRTGRLIIALTFSVCSCAVFFDDKILLTMHFIHDYFYT